MPTTEKYKVIGLCAALLSAGVMADPLEDSVQAWRSGDRAIAVATWRALAAKGDAEASVFLGYIYRNGLGVARDDGLAAEWYRRAARLGQPEAQYELALMYELGVGVARDADEAAVWYGLATSEACPAELSAGGRLGDR